MQKLFVLAMAVLLVVFVTGAVLRARFEEPKSGKRPPKAPRRDP